MWNVVVREISQSLFRSSSSPSPHLIIPYLSQHHLFKFPQFLWTAWNTLAPKYVSPTPGLNPFLSQTLGWLIGTIFGPLLISIKSPLTSIAYLHLLLGIAILIGPWVLVEYSSRSSETNLVNGNLPGDLSTSLSGVAEGVNRRSGSSSSSSSEHGTEFGLLGWFELLVIQGSATSVQGGIVSGGSWQQFMFDLISGLQGVSVFSAFFGFVIGCWSVV